MEMKELRRRRRGGGEDEERGWLCLVLLSGVVWLVLESIDLSAGRNQRFSMEIALNYISVAYL